MSELEENENRCKFCCGEMNIELKCPQCKNCKLDNEEYFNDFGIDKVVKKITLESLHSNFIYIFYNGRDLDFSTYNNGGFSIKIDINKLMFDHSFLERLQKHTGECYGNFVVRDLLDLLKQEVKQVLKEKQLYMEK